MGSLQTTTSSVSQHEVDSDAEAGGNFHMPQLPENVANFFSHVGDKGYPKTRVTKTQPWLKVWEGIVEPDENGKLLVACPKKSDFGR
jgi:hypothetical protein